MKTLVIGLDAATWRHLDPMIEAGELPTLGALADEGARGTLDSTMPPMTPLAWTSMATGQNPGKHGVYDFFELDRETYELSTTDFDRMDRAAVWDVFDAEGVEAGFFNVPAAFPPPQAGSFFVSGIPSDVTQDIAHPPALLSRLRETEFDVQPDVTPHDGLERYFEAVRDHTDSHANLVTDLIAENDLDHLWTVFMGLDWIQHYLWDTTIDGENAVRRCYRHLDSVIGDLLDAVDGDPTVLVVSDHGARRIDGEIHLNSVLADRGFAVEADGADGLPDRLSSSVIETGWRVGKLLPEGIRSLIKTVLPATTMDRIERDVGVGHETVVDDLDWPSTSAFSYGYMGRIFIHRSDRYPDGRVTPDEYEAVRNRIESAFESATHPETGNPLFEAVHRSEDIYDGERVDDAADLLLVPADWKYMMYGDFGEEWIHEPRERVADHEPEGVLIASGPNVESGDVDANVVDVAPTLLALHGLPTLDTMDGRAIDAVIANGWAGDSVSEATYRPTGRVRGRSADEETAARERLEDLGYL